MLGLVRAQFGELESAFKRMAQVQVDQHRLHEYFRRVFAEPRRSADEERYQRALEQARRDRDAAEEYFIQGRGNDMKGVQGTLWAAYNGVAEYVDYGRLPKASRERLLDSIWFGDGYLIKARAYAAAEQVLHDSVN